MIPNQSAEPITADDGRGRGLFRLAAVCIYNL